MDNYTIVLFKNKVKKRIIKKFKTFNNAKNFFDKLKEENKSVIFDVKTENGRSCNYEIALVSKKTNNAPLYVRDDFGRQVKIEIEDPEFSIIHISPFKKEEHIFDIKNSKRISVSTFLRKYLPKVGVKLVSKINHKISVQHDSQIDLFSLKSEEDCDRFIDVMSTHFMDEGRIDTIWVKDTSMDQKKYLYNILESQGYPKSILYRRFTTFNRE